MLKEPLHGVVVSDGYSDYLDIALAHNRSQLDNCVVVTSPNDIDSQQIAGKYACDLIITNDGRRKDGTFNKGAMIERGLQQLPQSGWRIHFDADTVWPGNFRKRLNVALHDKSAIYGVDRLNVVGEKRYLELLNSGYLTRGFEHHHFLTYPLRGLEVGGRLVFDDQGYIPIGFTQIWHDSQEYTGIYRTRPYATGSNSAAHDDVQFALRWDRSKRILIPELFVLHLLTEDMKHGKNWKGRKTRPFNPYGKMKSQGGPSFSIT